MNFIKIKIWFWKEKLIFLFPFSAVIRFERYYLFLCWHNAAADFATFQNFKLWLVYASNEISCLKIWLAKLERQNSFYSSIKVVSIDLFCFFLYAFFIQLSILVTEESFLPHPSPPFWAPKLLFYFLKRNVPTWLTLTFPNCNLLFYCG